MRSAREASSSSDGTQRVSLKDIADELGISQTAVSFAINDRPGVSAETKRRVKEAAARLGWTPVYAAQALGSSKTMTIGFAPARSTQGLTDESFMLHFMAGVHASLSPKGYGLLYRPCRFLNEEMSVYKDWASRKRVDGVILVDLRADDPRPELLKNLGVRAVLAKRRKLESINIEFTDFVAEQAAMLTLEMLHSPKPPTAFIYETEILAAASLHAMAEDYSARQMEAGEGHAEVYPNGLPAIVSFEDSFICEAAYPSITAAHRDASEYGAKVAKLLLKVLAGEQVSGNRRILTPKLVIRDSTAKPMDTMA